MVYESRTGSQFGLQESSFGVLPIENQFWLILQSGKWGFVDGRGAILADPRFLVAGAFNQPAHEAQDIRGRWDR
jgi:hypothetical protein